jgi:hypothetical protein
MLSSVGTQAAAMQMQLLAAPQQIDGMLWCMPCRQVQQGHVVPCGTQQAVPWHAEHLCWQSASISIASHHLHLVVFGGQAAAAHPPHTADSTPA